MFWIREKNGRLVFKIFLQPRSSRNMIAGLHGDSLKLKITAPPVAGAANQMCLEYLAKRLKISKSSLEIVSGHKNRTKHIMVKDTSIRREHLTQLITL